MRIFLKVSAIILALIIIAIVAATQLISTDDIVNQVSTKVEQATGRTLSVDGDKQLSFFPSLSIELNKVHFANAQFGSKPNMATVEALNIHIPWLSIFSGELTIDKFVIVNPDILLETTADGQVNWQFPAATNTDEESSEEFSSKNTDTAAVLPDGFDVRLGQVEIQGGKLTILDHKNQTTKVIDQLSLAVLLPSLKETLTVSGSVRYMAKVFELESSISTPAHVINNQPFTVKLSMLSDLTNVNYKGEIQNKGQDIKGKLSISGDSVKQILAWQNMPLEAKDEAFNQFTLASDMHFANNKLTLKDISVELDKLAFTGSSTITLSEPLTINADIDLGSLNLNPYLPQSTITEPTKPSTEAKSEVSSEPLVWDDAEIDLSALGLINAELAIKSSELLVREIKLGQNKLAINLHQGKAKINLLDFQAYQGQGTGTIEVLANKKPYQISSKFELDKINAEPLLTDAAGFDKLMGKGQLAWNISTKGTSQKGFIEQLNGELSFSFVDGAIRGMNLAAIAKSANNIMTGNLAAVSLDSDFSHAEKTDFAALTGTFNISNGSANTDNISLHNPFIRVSGAGDIDLPQTTMKMHIVTEMVASLEGQAAQETSSGIKIPIKISGPFHQVKIRPDITDQAKEKLKEKAKEKVKDKLKKLFGQGAIIFMDTTLYYIHDPMCSWCWGYRPVWDTLKLSLPSIVQIEYVAGGLAPDSNNPMPAEQQAMIKVHWRTIEEKLGTQFNYEFWDKNTPRRSTYNACRAVIAAHNQGCQVAMVEAIQQAYYLRALNPSDKEVLIGLAEELSLDLSRFVTDLSSEVTEHVLMQQINFARELTQQGFPSLVLEYSGVRHSIAINYQNYQVTLAEINHLLHKKRQ